MAFDAFFGIRAELELKARYMRLSRQPEHRGRDETTLSRMALEDWMQAEETRLRMKPITAEEIEEYAGLITERAARPPSPSPVAAGPGAVSYHTAQKRTPRTPVKKFLKG